MASRQDGYSVRPVFDGLLKKPYVTLPIEVIDTFLNLPTEDDTASALWAYAKYVLFGVEDVPPALAVAWPLLRDKADRTLEGIRNVKKRSDRNPTVAPTVAPTDTPSEAPSLLNHNHNHNHNPNQLTTNHKDVMSGKPDVAPIVRDVIGYLNERTGKQFKVTEGNTRHNRARIKEGYTLEDFRKVIDTMTAKWGRDPNMCRYLRPETLFGSKFDSYLNVGSVTRERLNDYDV